MGRSSKKNKRHNGPLKVCSSCGGKYKNKHTTCNSHHTQPTSRGGLDGSQNEVLMRRKEQHSPYHNLFANLRVGEAVRLLVFDWDTICPHQEKAESDTDDDRLVTRIENWNTLFGENADLESVLSIIFRRYVRLRKDKYKIRKVLHDAFVCGYIDKKEERYFLHILKNS